MDTILVADRIPRIRSKVDWERLVKKNWWSPRGMSILQTALFMGQSEACWNTPLSDYAHLTEPMYRKAKGIGRQLQPLMAGQDYRKFRMGTL